MKKVSLRIGGCLFAAMLFLMVFSSLPVRAAQYGTNFKFKDIEAMKEDGWSISHPEGVIFKPNGILLDGSSGATTITYADGVPADVMDWKVGARGTWQGLGGHGYLNIQVNTRHHTYVYVLDGASAQYVLWRDGIKVIGIKGYKEAANSQFEFYLEKTGSSISISCNSKKISTYTENDPSPVASVTISAPRNTGALYSWAGAFIPEPRPEDPTDGTDTEPTGTDTEPTEPVPTETEPVFDLTWLDFDPTDTSYIDFDFDTFDSIQDNPGQNFDFSETDPDGQISEPPEPDNSTLVPQNSSYPIWIVIVDGTFSINTEQPLVNNGATAEAGYYLCNGIGLGANINIADEADQEFYEQEQAMFDAGLIAPETHFADYNPYNGSTPSYYVKINTHISGDLNNPQTVQSAVAQITYIITDSSGQAIHQNTITAVASEGQTIDYYHCQAAQAINSYLATLIKP